MARNSDRMSRVNEIIKRELGQILERHRPENGIISVTEVNTAPNLRNAIVKVSVLGGTLEPDDAEREAIRFLVKNRILIQRELANRVVLQFTPVLRFKADRTLAAGDHVLAVMTQLEMNGVLPEASAGNAAAPDAE